MPRVLVVDNLTVHLPRLLELVKEKLDVSSLTVETTRQVTRPQAETADVIILSGGTGRSIERNPETFRRLVDFGVEAGTPIIGICLGAEALATYFEGSIEQMDVRRVGNVRIQLEGSLQAALRKESIMANEFHKWLISSVGPMEVLATSKDKIEAFRHRFLPVFGMQFHPEIRRKENEGHRVFETFLRWAGLAVRSG